tara:strand:- start:7632 stop:8216 length:585 start_codon:yes stop_codon:yes gene_type:complete
MRTICHIDSCRILFFLAFLCAFSFFSCSYDQNPCYEINCEKNEVCIDGNCVKLTSDNKDFYFFSQPEPDTIVLSEFYIERIPELRANGLSWDSGSFPDVYIQILQNGKIIYATPNSIQNLNNSLLPLKLNIPNPFEITDINKVISINFYDDDGNNFDEFMGGVTFNPYQEEYPDSIQADLGGPVAVSLSARYIF